MNTLNIFTDIKGPKAKYIVRGDLLGPPHGTTPAAVIANKIEWFDPLEAVKHSKGDSMDHIAQFRVMNPHQYPPSVEFYLIIEDFKIKLMNH